mgnify:CR=1 FL=1
MFNSLNWLILRPCFDKGWINQKIRIGFSFQERNHSISLLLISPEWSDPLWLERSPPPIPSVVLSKFDRPMVYLFSQRCQLTDDTYWGVQPLPKVVDARCTTRLCLCSPMLESLGPVLLTTPWACWWDTGCGLFLSWGVESLIRWNLKGNSHWLQSFYIRADNESDIRRQVSRIQELFCKRFAKPEIKLSTIFAAKLSLKNWYYSWI